MFVPKTFKKLLLVSAVGVAAGTLLFGGELLSYAKSSIYTVQRETKAAVPVPEAAESEDSAMQTHEDPTRGEGHRRPREFDDRA